MTNSRKDELFGHPKGLYVLLFTEMWERFSFYGMRALLILYMTNHFFWSQEDASSVMGTYAFFAYAMPLFGGIMADKWLGARRAIVLGALLLTAGHFLLAFESLFFFYTALTLIVSGVGFLKPNISTQVGSLYKPGDPRRDGAFTIFYMGINLGAFFGPLICGWLRVHYGYHYGFGAAGVGMLLGLLVYVLWQRRLVEFSQEVEEDESAGDKVEAPVESHRPHVTRDRVTVLLIVFAFVILFWMAFEQSANVMVVWADKHTNLRVFSLEPPPVVVDGAPAGGTMTDTWRDIELGAGATQSINPFFIITLAPFVAMLWIWLARRKRQPSTPAKMALGIALVAGAFLVMVPAASFENRVSQVQLNRVPQGMDLSQFGATRLHHDAEEGVLRMKGVLPDLDRLRLLAETAPEGFTKALIALFEKASNSDTKSASQDLTSAPPGFGVRDEEAAKVAKWDPVTQTLTLTGVVSGRARVELLASGADPTFKEAVDKLYIAASMYRISIWWLFLHYLLATMGELCLSPVGLSLVTKMAPAKHASTLMGGWFLSTAVAEKLAHVFGGMWGTMTPTRYFMFFVVVCGGGALLMALIVPKLKRMMHGID